MPANPGHLLAGVGVSFLEAGIGVGAAPDLTLAGKLRALRAGRENLGAEADHGAAPFRIVVRIVAMEKARENGPGALLLFYRFHGNDRPDFPGLFSLWNE